MGRNYFSKAGGPYFINDGFTHHTENINKTPIKPDIKVFYGLTTVFVSLILGIGIALYFLN
jgi:hypothetical protein